MTNADLIHHLRRELPTLLAVYLFGSRAIGTATAGSDLDVAVLVEGMADPLRLFEVSGTLADIAGCPVDLLDLRAASTVMQYQIICSDQLIWARDSSAGIYESFILSDKTELDEVRAELLADIQQSGRVYGR